jgi:hypothetical protein
MIEGMRIEPVLNRIGPLFICDLDVSDWSAEDSAKRRDDLVYGWNRRQAVHTPFWTACRDWQEAWWLPAPHAQHPPVGTRRCLLRRVTRMVARYRRGRPTGEAARGYG